MALKTLSSRSAEDADDSEIVAEINITPLVDIFLVLLIIFMVTSSVMSQLGVDVELPASGQGTAQSQDEGVIVTLLPSGGVKVNEVTVSGQGADGWSRDEFRAMMTSAFEKTKSRLVILEGDRRAYLGSAIEVMDIAKAAGATRFAVATQPEAKK